MLLYQYMLKPFLPKTEPQPKPNKNTANIKAKAYTLFPATTASMCMDTTSNPKVTAPHLWLKLLMLLDLIF